MARHKAEGKEKAKLKRMRRIRGGRKVAQSGAGVHEDKKSKKVERQRVKELDDEISNWQEIAAADLADDLEGLDADIDDEEFWDEWKYPDLFEDDDWDEE